MREGFLVKTGVGYARPEMNSKKEPCQVHPTTQSPVQYNIVFLF